MLFPTTIVGSYPQPDWLIDRAGLAKRFPPRVRAKELWRIPEAYLVEAQNDATLLAIRAQEDAGLDIVTDGDARFDNDVGGMSWVQYPARRLDGLAGGDYARMKKGYGGTRKGDILFEVMESRVMPRALR